MLVASVDPGETTGLVIYDTVQRQVIHRESEDIETIRRTLSAFEIETLLLELQPDRSDLDDAVLAEYRTLRREYRHIEVPILPSVWKPWARRKKWKAVGDQHLKDAYNMLRYWMVVVGRQDIGDGLPQLY